MLVDVVLKALTEPPAVPAGVAARHQLEPGLRSRTRLPGGAPACKATYTPVVAALTWPASCP